MKRLLVGIGILVLVLVLVVTVALRVPPEYLIALIFLTIFGNG